MVAAGVTGASIAMPLFGAVSAQAADTQTWDRVAECESGGMWSANGGNGFYGGLQITLDMWRKYGGQQYAPRPDLASRSQQIAIAQAILGDRGPDAWPSCALGAGLADLGDLGDLLEVDPDGKGTPASQGAKEAAGIDDSATGESSDNSSQGDRPDSSDSSGASGESGTSDKADKSDPSVVEDGKSGDKGDKSGDSGEVSREEGGSASDEGDTPSGRDAKGEDDSSGAPTGRHRGAPDAREQDSAGTADDDARSSGRHASRDDAERAETPLQPLGRADYTVRGDDNLSDIAGDQGDQKADGGWPELYEANETLIGTDPDLIHPGQRLDLSAR
ncbi:transglycosylase family protein [Streptomyces sp. ME19-01-6]|uniref:transglycosylase family protein n=1 Tax=Streptomyces sp. ME19-01-6 TaxID=3028686 RepID=UPI0029C9C6C3|nr:transglycosylase family protein [Streptomyces sp. ME19-01-6]